MDESRFMVDTLTSKQFRSVYLSGDFGQINLFGIPRNESNGVHHPMNDYFFSQHREEVLKFLDFRLNIKETIEEVLPYIPILKDKIIGRETEW